MLTTPSKNQNIGQLGEIESRAATDVVKGFRIPAQLGGGAKIPTSKVNPFQISRLSKSDVGLGPMTFVWFFVSKLCDGTRSPRAKNEHNACRSRLFDLFV